jgi:3-hydroxyisobutyrate dehydrogenase
VRKSAAMLDGAFEPSFALDGVLKDIGLMHEAASAAGVDDTLLTTCPRCTSRRGHGDDDMAAVYTAFRADEGS